MIKKEYRRFYVLSLAVLLVLSVYMLVNRTRTAYPGIVNETNGEDDLFGCYEFDECLYMNPLSSFIPLKGFMPYVYGVGEDSLVIANTETGHLEQLPAQYEKTAVAEDELSSKTDFILKSSPIFNLSQYKERRMRAVFTGETGQQYSLYQMDDEIWLVRLNSGKLWSIYKLRKTDKVDLADLERAIEGRDCAPAGRRQMTLRDVYELARKGENLTLRDFERFDGKAVGSGFMIMRYDMEDGCVLTVHSTTDSAPNYTRLSKRGCDPFDEALTVDIRAGAQAVTAYLNPLYSLMSLEIEDSPGGAPPRELIYEYNAYRYYLNTTRAARVFITFDNGERLPLKQALEERRLTVEDAVANGLYNVSMEPVNNPLGGAFPILHHLHKFIFDNEEFYPSASFMFVVYEDGFATYFDIAELAEILALQDRSELANKLRQIIKTNNLPVIAGKAYITKTGLAEAGIAVDIGWELSSHTPVSFISTSD